MEDLNKLLKERHEEFIFNDSDSTQWVLKNSTTKGRGLFAARDISSGEMIFKDIPTVIGPRFVEELPGCSACLIGGRPLSACKNRCGLPVCYGRNCDETSTHKNDCKLLKKLSGEVSQYNSSDWSPELYKALVLIRCLNMPQKEKELIGQLHAQSSKETKIQVNQLKTSLPNSLSEEDERWLHHCCGVLDGTAFEVPHSRAEGTWSLRGLYPLAAMMNHCCSPNTRHSFAVGFDVEEEERGPVMAVVATRDIAKDDEITTTYCPQLWSTPARRQFLLMTKQFQCSCQRCKDPTELGTNLSALNCTCKSGIVLPLNPLDIKSQWKCSECSVLIDAKRVLLLQAAAFKMNHRSRSTVLPPTNYLIIQAKLDSVWSSSKRINNLSNNELSENKNNIMEVLDLLQRLLLENSRISGLLYKELFKTVEEITKRGNNTECVTQAKELTKLWNKAISILQGDVLAPKIRRY